MEIALTILAAYGLCVVTWLFYLAVMNLKEHRDNMYWFARIHAYGLLGIGLVLDFVLNVIVGTVVFLKYPQNVLLTGRLSRYIRDPDEKPWRRKLACWICEHLLDQFDPNGRHCPSCSQYANYGGTD
jgi:hypothetical protein